MSERLKTGAVWTALDQAASTASNVIVLFAAARLSGAPAVAAFSFAFAIYLACLGINRALILDPLLTAPQIEEDLNRAVLALSPLLGAVLGAITSGVGFALDRPSVTVLGLLLPALLMQDAVRYVSFRVRLARVAFIADLIWCVALGLLVLAPRTDSDATFVTVVWGLGAAAAGVMGCVALRFTPKLSLSLLRVWRVTLGRYGLALAADSALFAFGQQIAVLWAVALASSDLVLGSLRGAQTLMGPLPALFAILNMLILPRAVQVEGRARIIRLMRMASLTGSALWISVIFVALDPLVSFAFDDAVAVEMPVLILLALQVVLMAVSLSPVAEMRAARRSRGLLLSRVVSVVVGVPFLFIFVWIPTVEMLAGGLLLQTAVYTVAASFSARRCRVRVGGERREATNESMGLA